MGDASAKKFNLKVGDRIPLIPTIWHNRDGTAWEFELFGIFTTEPGGLASDTAMYFNYAYFDEYRAFANGTVSTFLIRVEDPKQLSQLAKKIDKITANSSSETKTMSDQEYALSFAKQMGDIGLVVDAILAAVFFTIVMVTGNTIAQSTRERIPEFAVMKVLGFQSRAILSFVIVEVLMLTLSSAVIGMAIAQILLSQVATWLPQLTQLGSLYLEPITIIYGLALAMAIGLIVGLPAILKMMRMRIVDALRV